MVRVGRQRLWLLAAITASMLAPGFKSLAQEAPTVGSEPGRVGRLENNPFANRHSADGSREVRLPADANPFDPVWLNNYAVDMANKGWLGVAEEMFSRALKISPEDPVITSNLRRLRNWHQVRKSEYRPALGYSPEVRRPDAGVPAAPPPWSQR